MQHMWQTSEHKRITSRRFLVSALFLSIIIIQVSIACGFAPQARASTTLATSHMTNCANPIPTNNGSTAAPAPATPGIVVINEVLSAPQSQWNCNPSDNALRQSNAWVEIYNPQNQPYDLYAAHASIDEGPATKEYLLPFGSIISAYGFLVVFPFGNVSPSAFSQLSSVRLLINLQVVIDQVSLPSLPFDASYARIPDRSENWQITTTPTMGSSNQSILTAEKTATATSLQSQTTQPKSTQK